MNQLPRSWRDWLHRYSPMLINGACLAGAIWLAPQLVPEARLPVSGIILSFVVLVSVRSLAPEGQVGLRHLFWLGARPQLAVGFACLAAGRLLWSWPWSAFTFWPAWLALTSLSWLRFSPWRRLLAPLLNPGNQTAATGALLVGSTAFLFGRLAYLDGLGWPVIAGLALGWLLVDRLPVARWQDGADGRARLVRFGLRLAGWTAGTAIIATVRGVPAGREPAACLFVLVLALASFGLSQRQRLVAGSENTARTLFGLLVVGLIFPFSCHRLLGSQDAQWYLNTLADFLAQVRAGVFPVFVGQSEHLFNGGVLPVRFAPLFQHYGLFLDLLTLRSLPAAAVQNAVLIASFVGAAFTSWRTFATLLPARPWLTAILSALFLTCPGLLAVVYYEDLFMTWTTLPWLPVAFGACVASLRSPTARPMSVLGVTLGIIWWGHAPVALWTTLTLAVVQIARLAALSPRQWPWRALGWGAGSFVAVAFYPLVSVLAVPVQTGAASFSYTATGVTGITYFIRESFPGILLPLFAKTRALSDFQPGWALLGLLLLNTVIMIRWRVRNPGAWMLLAMPLALQALLVPLPGLDALWSLVPGFLVNPTGTWPMQRLYLVIASSSVAVAVFLLQDDEGKPRHPPRWLYALGIAALAWSIAAAIPLVRQKEQKTRGYALGVNWVAPENHVLTRYAYLAFGGPPGYYSHGHVDPAYEQRFLSADRSQRIGGNPHAILTNPVAGRVLHEGALSAVIIHPGDPWQISPHFTVEPHHRYALEIHFAHGAEPGVLLLAGGELRRNYGLPQYGERLSFGSGPEASPLLSLFTSGEKPVDIGLQFVADQPGSKVDFSRFGTYRWLEVDPGALPIRVTGWIPYTAEVDAPAGVLLETPRMFQPGYRATVNGRAVTPEKSPEGLVAVPVPAGRSTVVLSYHAPLLLLSAYWISLAALLGSAGAMLRAIWRSPRIA